MTACIDPEGLINATNVRQRRGPQNARDHSQTTKLHVGGPLAATTRLIEPFLKQVTTENYATGRQVGAH